MNEHDNEPTPTAAVHVTRTVHGRPGRMTRYSVSGELSLEHSRALERALHQAMNENRDWASMTAVLTDDGQVVTTADRGVPSTPKHVAGLPQLGVQTAPVRATAAPQLTMSERKKRALSGYYHRK